jgi:hypothetical protein
MNIQQLKTVFTGIIMVAIVTSCKKDHSTPPVVEKKISKLMNGSTVTGAFTYNTDGSLATYEAPKIKIVYDYSNHSYAVKYYSSNGYLFSEAKNAIIKNDRLQSLFYLGYNTDGSLSYNFTYHFTYNSDSTLAKYHDDNDANVYVFEYAGGNFTKVSHSNSGIVKDVDSYEYYADKPNKFNIPIQEYLMELPELVKNLLGKGNANLIKKETRVVGGNTFATTFTYKLDADGYVTQYTQVYQKNNETPVTTTIDVVY